MDKEQTNIIFIPNGRETITIKSTVKSIGKTTLQSSVKLTSVQFENGNSDIWSTEGGVLYSKVFDKMIAVCGGKTEIDVNSKVKTICESAAYGCMNLKNITFSGNLVNAINNKAFKLSGVQRITLPSSVKILGEEAFSDAVSLTEFTVSQDSQLEGIPNHCLKSSLIQSFYFGKNVKSIGSQAFYFCSKLTTLTFHPEIQITTFSDLSFGNTNLNKLVLPASIQTIPSRCFISNANLESLKFEENSVLDSIEDQAFSFCGSLKEVILPDSCSSIGVESFSICKKLYSFKHNLETISSSSFKGCIGLDSFNFSSRQSKEYLDPSAFLDCANVLSFTVSASEDSQLKGIGGSVFSANGTTLILFPPGQETAVIPPQTLEFANNAFAWSPNLKFVAFYSGSDLETIGASAFHECKKLEAVRFPPKLKEIRNGAFFGCVSLKPISFPDSLQSIGENAFIGCKRIKVNYCGTNFIQGQNVFDENVEIYVTDLYKESTFCNNRASKKLEFNCELKQEFLKVSCKVINYGRINIFSALATFLLINC